MTIGNLLFPKFCIGCNYIGTYICPDCFEKIENYPVSRCFYCKKTSYRGLIHPKCSNKLNIDSMTVIYKSDRLIRKIIKNIKYRLARLVMTELLLNIRPDDINPVLAMKNYYQGAVIQPIPLSKSRLNYRGFNQSLLLAEFFSKDLGLKVADSLIRNDSKVIEAGKTLKNGGAGKIFVISLAG